MKRTVILLLIVTFLLLSITATTYAASDTSSVNIEYYEDGSYLKTIIESETISPYISLLSTTVTKTKTTKFYDANNVAKWYVKVTGTFTYGAGTSKCTSSSVTAGSYVSTWKIMSKSATKSVNTATAKATAKQYYNGTVIKTINKTVSLKCSPTGTFT